MAHRRFSYTLPPAEQRTLAVGVGRTSCLGLPLVPLPLVPQITFPLRYPPTIVGTSEDEAATITCQMVQIKEEETWISRKL